LNINGFDLFSPGTTGPEEFNTVALVQLHELLFDNRKLLLLYVLGET